MESILTSIKKLLGPTEEHTHFDQDIIMHINSTFMFLNRLGVGPKEGFAITDSSTTWDDYIPNLTQNSVRLEGLRTYIYLKVKLVFDPPLNSTVLKSYEKQIEEYEWTLNAAVDPATE